MAPQSKNTNNKSYSSNKKTTTKKNPVKRRTRKKTSNFKKNILIVMGVFLMISLVSFGYFLGQNDTENTQPTASKVHKSKDTYSTQQLLDDLSQIKTKKPKKEKVSPEKVVKIEKERVVKSLPPVIVEERKSERNQVKKKSLKDEVKKKIALAHRSEKPKLAIIIDDVSSAKQLKHIKSLPIKVTPSIFPPYELSKSNHKLAQGLKHYMIHLPMQSGKAYDKQYGTLKITDSREKMEARVKEIRRLFPTARYINNHTGSAFTNNYRSMEMLYGLLRKEGFMFVDSRTTGKTKVRKIAYAYGDAYVARDIFIDNSHNIPYIHKQLREAVKIAKKRGYAIAIGHPHLVTMKALRSAQDIFKDVELVYIDEIYSHKR
jgi:polysaccharide deacetylase 2 family uncharacterized protein YibQ